VLVEVKVPVLAESIAEATLLNWHKRAGDEVKRGESLIDIETDKVTLEVAALNDGVLVEILKMTVNWYKVMKSLPVSILTWQVQRHLKMQGNRNPSRSSSLYPKWNLPHIIQNKKRVPLSVICLRNIVLTPR